MPTIKDDLKTLFNEQAAIEFTISNIYLALSFWFEERNYTGVSKYLKNSSNEEREHGLMFFNYILKRNAVNINVTVSESYDASIHKDALEIFRLIYDIEVENTIRLTNLADYCIKLKDYQSYNFCKTSS
jgi:ferritin